MFRLTITNAAIKGLKKAPPATAARIRTALDRLADDPDRRDLDIKWLRGRAGYRLRVGGYRVIYERDNEIRIIAVLAVGPRGGTY